MSSIVDKLNYGYELILDLQRCDPSTFTRDSLREFFVALCEKIGMERCDLHFWDYEGESEEYAAAPDHLKGVSAIQFITTSNITVHTLDVLGLVFLNIFSCAPFEITEAVEFCCKHFCGTVTNKTLIARGI